MKSKKPNNAKGVRAKKYSANLPNVPAATLAVAEADQGAPVAPEAAQAAPLAPAPETAAQGEPVGEREAVGGNIPDVNVSTTSAADTDAMAEALRLAYAWDVKPRDRKRALMLIEFADQHPRMERNSFLHGKITAAHRLLAETSARLNVVPLRTMSKPATRAIQDANLHLDPQPAPKPPKTPPNGTLADGALVMLKAVLLATGGEVGLTINYADIITPALSARERSGYIAGLARRGLVVQRYAAEARRFETSLTESGREAAQHG